MFGYVFLGICGLFYWYRFWWVNELNEVRFMLIIDLFLSFWEKIIVVIVFDMGCELINKVIYELL